MAGDSEISRKPQFLVLSVKKTIRSFIAVDIPPDIQRAIGDRLSPLQKETPEVRWVKPLNLHLTLKFLGDVEPAQLDVWKEKLYEVFKNEKRFFMEFSTLGGFPNLRVPQVLWIGVRSGEESLKNLAKKLEAVACALGFQKESRPFSAHLTLGRVKHAKPLSVPVERLTELKFDFIPPIMVNHVTLYKSILTSGGAYYEPVEKIAFA